MQRIFKYTLNVVDLQVIEVLMPAKILSVTSQNENIVLYVIVNEEDNKIPIAIRIFSTRQPLTLDIDQYTFIGSVKIKGGKHVFAKRITDPIEKEKLIELCKSANKIRVEEIEDKREENFGEIKIVATT